MKIISLTLLSAAFSCMAVEAWTGKCTGGYTWTVCAKLKGKNGFSDKYPGYGKPSCYGINEATCKVGFKYWCEEGLANISMGFASIRLHKDGMYRRAVFGKAYGPALRSKLSSLVFWQLSCAAHITTLRD
ncbi:hypothetical protein BGZ51_005564 [Haplosporangium sp. Z 767]|nr:hypothetical protein BGZ51_005564 [Haplosporangium sp. Z 767]KAF9181377.1 hypothetical protein BGZ50_005529 [Haplosporangium sp. Z 11]